MATSSAFLRKLREDLAAEIVPEMEMTMRVAVYTAAGHNRTSIASVLGCEDIEVKMCMRRLKRVADTW